MQRFPLPGHAQANRLKRFPPRRLQTFGAHAVTRSALIAALLVLAACKPDDKKSEPDSRAVPQAGFVVLKARSLPLTVELPGRTAAFETSEVRPQVSGILKERLFSEGALVRAGQTLYRIDPRLYEAAVTQARADLASTVALHEAARTRAQRFAELAQAGVVSRQDLLDVQASAASAGAAADRGRATLATAQISLEFTRVSAPISGRIGRSIVTTGALVTAAQAAPLTTIQRLDPIFVDIQQSSAALLALRRDLAAGGDPPASAEVRLVLEDGTGYPHTGVLQFAEPMVDMSTGTVTLRARFPNTEGLLLPGMYVRAQFSPTQRRDAILAPQQGISRDAKGNATALVVGPDSLAQLRTVTTERTVGDQWLIGKGLRSGDRLIVEGLGRIKPGQKIRPTPARVMSQNTSAAAARDTAK